MKQMYTLLRNFILNKTMLTNLRLKTYTDYFEACHSSRIIPKNVKRSLEFLGTGVEYRDRCYVNKSLKSYANHYDDIWHLDRK